MTEFEVLIENLVNKIKASFNGLTQEGAEGDSFEYLDGMLQVSSELTVADLDSRMRKTGVKAVRASIYLDAATKSEKKPSDVMLQALVDVDIIVQKEQNDYDKAEVKKAELERVWSVLKEAHILTRGIAKGKSE